MEETRIEEWRAELRRGLLNISLKFGEGVDRQGKPYEWLFDTRELLLYGQYLPYAARLLWERLKPYRPEMVGGMTLAANPLTIALLYESRGDTQGVDGFLIRREAKRDGLRKLVEGPPIRAGTRVALLDDLVNMGDTQRQALAALEPFDCQVVAVGVLIDYQRDGTRWLRSRGIPVEALFTLTELGVAKETPALPDAGRLLWTIPSLNSGEYKAPKSSPRAAGDTLYVGSDRGSVVALSLDGEERWRFEVRDRERGVHSTPLHYRGRVYFGAYDGYLYCVDAATGKLVWEIRQGQWIGSSPTVDPDRGVVFAGIEYGERGGSLIGVDAETGAIRWEMKARGYLHSSPCYDAPRSQVLVGGNDGAVYAADARSGAPRWVFHTNGEVKGNPVVDEEGVCFAGSYDGFLYAIRADLGILSWRRKLSHRLYANPLLWEGLVIVGGFSGRLVALDRQSGAVRWVGTTRGPIIGGAALVGKGMVAVGSQDGSVYLFEAESGKLLWEYATGGAIMTIPGVFPGGFALPSLNGTLYCFALAG